MPSFESLVAANNRKPATSAFRDPTKPAYWTTPAPASVKSTRGDPDDIQSPELVIAPSKHQDPNHQDYELPLDETASLLFYTFKGTPIVQVVRREPKPTNPRTLKPSVIAPFLWLGLIARAKRAGYSIVKGILLSFGGRCRYPARRLLSSYHRLNCNPRSLAAFSLPERTSRAHRRPFYILSSLLVAAREAMSLGRRIG